MPPVVCLFRLKVELDLNSGDILLRGRPIPIDKAHDAVVIRLAEMLPEKYQIVSLRRVRSLLVKNEPENEPAPYRPLMRHSFGF